MEKYACDGSVLDLACGNGDLALIAYSVVKKQQLNHSIYAIDYSNIRLREDIQGKDALDYISWLPNTYAEDLPIEDNSIALVLSQFGFEYTNIEETVVELARVIKIEGKLSFLIHHDDSFISRQSDIELPCYEALLFKEKLFTSAKSLINSAAIEKGSIESEELRHELNQKLSRVHNKYKGCSAVIAFVHLLKDKLSNLSKIKNNNYWREFDALEHSFKAHHKRLTQMMNSVYSEKDIAKLEDIFINNGFKSLGISVYHTEIGILGWWVNMERC